MKRLIVLLLAVSTWAAPVISNVVVNDITAHGVRIEWQTDVAATDNAITFSTTSGATPTTSCATPYAAGLSCATLQNFASTTHGWFISALVPATTYYYKVRSTASGETYSSEGSFTTAAAELGLVTAPTAPAAVDIAEPTSFVTTKTVSADCSNLQTQINAAAAEDGNDNHRVLIPANAVCVGLYTLPAKSGVNPSGTGWIAVVPDATIPPSGARLEPSMVTALPRIISPMLGLEAYQSTAPTGCLGNPNEVATGWLDSDSTDPNAFLHWCTALTPTWTAVPMSSGASVPSSCTPTSSGPYFYNTSEADAHKRVSICDPAGVYVTYYIDYRPSVYGGWAAFTVAANAARWYVKGVRIERPHIPASYTDLLPTSSTGWGNQWPSRHPCLVTSATSSDRIVFDRTYFDYLGYPKRGGDVFCFFHGSNMAVKGSYFNNPAYWRPADSAEMTPAILYMEQSTGPWLFENNYVKNCHGICIFAADSGSTTSEPHDGTVRRNTFYEDPADNCSGVASNGHCYHRRHFFECKRCVTTDIIGNTFDGGWPSTNQGATIGLTPRAGAAASTAGIADIMIRYNKILYTPQAVLLTGHNDYQSFQNPATKRIEISHNLIYSSGKASDGSTDGWPNGSDFNGQAIDVGLGLQNFKFSNNAHIRPTSPSQQANAFSNIADFGPYKNTRLLLTSNTYTALDGVNNQGYWGWQASTSNLGTAALDAIWTRVDSAASYTASGNAMQKFYNGAFVDTASYPAGNYRSETASNFTGALYRCIPCGDLDTVRPLPGGILASGSATARGYDGRDNGPDWVAFDIAQGGTRNLRALSVATTTASVYFTAPDAVACTVEYGTSATPMTGTRVTATLGSSIGGRDQHADLTSLTGATTYYARVMGGGCPVMASSSFTTQ